MRHFLILSFLACLQLASCQQNAPTATVKGATNAEAPKMLQVTALSEFLTAYPTATFLDVRTPEEYANGYIKGGRLLDFTADDFKTQLETLNKVEPIVVYCQAGGRSGKAAKMLESMGFASIYDVEGGFSAWEAAKLPVEMPK